MLKSIEGGIKTLASSGLSSFFKLSESIGKNGGGNTYTGDFLGK